MKTNITYSKTSQGAWELSAIITKDIYAWVEHSQYMGYTKLEATKLFKQRLKELTE
jgi:hypothetical protein